MSNPLRSKVRMYGAMAALLASLAVSTSALAAADIGGFIVLEFDTSLSQLNLTGPAVPMPLGSDPTNSFPDSVEGYGFVDSVVTVTLSSQRAGTPGPASTGSACAYFEGGYAAAGDGRGCDTGPDLEPIDPADYDGQPFYVDSFFDVFFDITVTDVDDRPGRDFGGQPDGATITLTDNGPAYMSSGYTAMFDAGRPDENFGLVPPPEADPYIGHFSIEIPLGGDLNGNAINDKIKFNLVAHSVGDENRTFIQLPGGGTQDTFDSAAFLEGAVVDETSDPPFTIGAMLPSGLYDPAAFGGPTVATSYLMNPIVPEPTTLALLAGGVLVLARRRRR